MLSACARSLNTSNDLPQRQRQKEPLPPPRAGCSSGCSLGASNGVFTRLRCAATCTLRHRTVQIPKLYLSPRAVDVADGDGEGDKIVLVRRALPLLDGLPKFLIINYHTSVIVYFNLVRGHFSVGMIISSRRRVFKAERTMPRLSWVSVFTSPPIPA